MDNSQLTEKICALAEGITASEGKQFIEFVVPVEQMHSLGEKLKDDPSLAFDFLFCLTAVDHKDFFTVVYHLDSTKYRHRIVLKTNITDRSNPLAASVSDIWRTAEFHEREVFDLFGIRFSNHPDLRRLFLDDDYGFPLRKDFVDEINIVEL
jgi:NADH-quinone oxidoreductase subunit C